MGNADHKIQITSKLLAENLKANLESKFWIEDFIKGLTQELELRDDPHAEYLRPAFRSAFSAAFPV